MLYIVHFTAFCSGGPFFSGHGVVILKRTPSTATVDSWSLNCKPGLEDQLMEFWLDGARLIIINLLLLRVTSTQFTRCAWNQGHRVASVQVSVQLYSYSGRRCCCVSCYVSNQFSD